ncbi:MAG: AarF/ABC1/UbiB kinase family protein, partial [Desulfobacterales bacterium]|nr:AarF/ABC1/UbiB kinase family protein [Desulfobacterales bacterium]
MKNSLFQIGGAFLQETISIVKGAGNFTYGTLKISSAFIPLTKLLAKEENIDIPELRYAIDVIFQALYKHPITKHGHKVTQYLRIHNLIPNEQTTEQLIRYLVEQVLLRSPIPIPEVLINEFWNFFHELFSQPELKGLVELNLDIIRLLLKSYEPLLVDVINLLKEAKRINQSFVIDVVKRVKIVRNDLTIIKRQIKALRYLKPFFMTDPKDFKTQAKIVARMVREFGPFFIKMAQVAASNSDFLPEEISQELIVFQEDVPPMTADEVLKVFEETIGKKPYECYFDFNVEKPIKSGSIGCVYLAKKPTYINGNEVLIPVVVKVGRYGLDREFLMGKTVIGLALLSSNYWAPHSKLAPFLNAWQEQVDQFVDGFQKELNFEHEAEIQEKFAERSKDSTIWKVPRVYFSSKCILEMEYIPDAVNISHAIDIFTSSKTRIQFSRQLASRFLYTVLMHIFIYQEFHGDLHPGNVLINSKGDLFFIDWGNCVNMQGKWKPVWRYAAGAICANVELLAQALIDISADPVYQESRRSYIIATLTDTLKKKNVAPLGKNFVFQ